METNEDQFEEWFCWWGLLKCVGFCLALGLALLVSMGGF